MTQLFILACGVFMISLSSCSTECVCTTTASGEGAELFPTTTTVENTEVGNVAMQMVQQQLMV